MIETRYRQVPDESNERLSKLASPFSAVADEKLEKTPEVKDVTLESVSVRYATEFMHELQRYDEQIDGNETTTFFGRTALQRRYSRSASTSSGLERYGAITS